MGLSLGNFSKLADDLLRETLWKSAKVNKSASSNINNKGFAFME